MTVDWKKKLIPNLPYLLFVYLFDKLCQAVRLAPGLDASEKFLHLSQGFTEAFSSGLQACIRWTCWRASPGRSLFGWRCMPRARIQRNIARALSTAAPMGHGGRYCPLCRSGSRLEHPSDPDGKAHHVQPPEKSQVRPEQKHPGHRRQRQRQRPGSSSSPPSCRCTAAPMWSPIPKDSFCPRWGTMLRRAPPSWTRTESPMRDARGKVIYEPYRIKVLNTINFKRA